MLSFKNGALSLDRLKLKNIYTHIYIRIIIIFFFALEKEKEQLSVLDSFY